MATQLGQEVHTGGGAIRPGLTATAGLRPPPPPAATSLLAASLSRLRLQAIIACTAAFFLAGVLPAVSYYYVFQHDQMGLGPQAWAHWGVVLLPCLLGIVAHGTASTPLTALHAALGAMLAAALGGYSTAFWFALDLRCQALVLASPTDEICSAVVVQQNKLILAFTGLATVVFLAVTVSYSLLVLSRGEGERALAAAKRHSTCFAVEIQTALVAGGDKPTVTPAMLTEWVQSLYDAADDLGDEACGAAGARCKVALGARGFELPAMRRKEREAEEERRRRQDLEGGLGGSFRIDAAVQPAKGTAQVTFYVSPGSAAKGKPPRRPQVAASAEEILPEEQQAISSTVHPGPALPPA